MAVPRAYAVAEVLRAAPDAPESAHNMAAIAIVAYMLDAPPAAPGGGFANAWANSGAVFILRPWLLRRAVALTEATA